MTTLYRPVLIESAEQAEALPVGTVAAPMYEDGPDFVYALVRREGTYEPWCNSDGSHARGHGELDGFVALVPIEAEGETFTPSREGGEATINGPRCLTAPSRRYVTPWEEA